MEFDSADSRLGIVVNGSLNRGVDIKLDGNCSIEDMAAGRFVTIQGERRRFFGIITDISLASADERLAATPPDVSDPFIARVVSGTSVFGEIHVTPYLTANSEMEILPAKTIPPHFAVAKTSSPQEVEMIFGENDDKHIWIGSPLDMEGAMVCLDVKKLVERSTGVFGKTGTGKSFLTRILLVEIIHKSGAMEAQGQKAPVSLIFDMHGEYGWGSNSESGIQAKGLKQLVGSQVVVFGLDQSGIASGRGSPDVQVQISFDDIEPEDIAVLAETLGLSEPMVLAAFSLRRKLGVGWLAAFLQASDKDELLALGGGLENESTLMALHRKLVALESFEFITTSKREDSVRRLMEYLDRGMHVVLEFGRYTNNLAAYIFVANFLTRRLHTHYVDRMEKSLGRPAEEPRPLVITIEEAHKFLSPQLAGQTIFGTIARELRKYNVTLLVVDQRPSGIDAEIMSQLGSKITCLLENDRDIDAVLAGASGGKELRVVLAKLESSQQALIFGHAVPMPVVVRTRTYDASFYKSLGVAARPARREDHETSDAEAVAQRKTDDRDVADLFR